MSKYSMITIGSFLNYCCDHTFEYVQFCIYSSSSETPAADQRAAENAETSQKLKFALPDDYDSFLAVLALHDGDYYYMLPSPACNE